MEAIKYVVQLSVDELKEIIRNTFKESFEEFLTAVKELLKNFDEVLSLEDVCLILGREKPTVEDYIKEGKITVHHFKVRSPVFLKSEIFENIKALPSLMKYNPIKQKLDFIKSKKESVL